MAFTLLSATLFADHSCQDFSKINAGLMSLEFLPLDLVSVVDRSILMLLAPARERGVVMSREACADFPVTLFGDELRLQQVGDRQRLKHAVQSLSSPLTVSSDYREFGK